MIVASDGVLLFLNQDYSHFRTWVCAPCQSQWCSHVEDFISSNGDVNFYAPDQVISLPFMPDSRIYVLIRITSDSKTLLEYLTFEGSTLSIPLGTWFQGEGIISWRYLIYEYVRNEFSRKIILCESHLHSKRIDSLFNTQLKTASYFYLAHGIRLLLDGCCNLCYRQLIKSADEASRAIAGAVAKPSSAHPKAEPTSVYDHRNGYINPVSLKGWVDLRDEYNRRAYTST